MSKSMSENISDAGKSVVTTVQKVGSSIVHGAERAGEFMQEKTGLGATENTDLGLSAISEHMDVIASCGKKVGVVDDVEGDTIKLTRKDSHDNQHHFIPVGWVERVDSHVHLNKNSKETEQQWKPNDSSCGCS